MKEYIERESAIKGILNDCCELVFYTKENAIDYLEAMPAADVAEVRHGHWTDVGSLSCRCSECGCKNSRETAYCPICGARMDKEDEHEAD